MKHVLIVAVSAVALGLAACGSAAGTQGLVPEGGGDGGQAGATGGSDGGGGGLSAAQLAGDWLGPAPGDAGDCGAAYGEWVFTAGGEYSVTDNSEDCDGFTMAGRYEVAGDVITFDQTESTCGDCGEGEYSVSASLSGSNALQMCDLPADGICYAYQRQG